MDDVKFQMGNDSSYNSGQILHSNKTPSAYTETTITTTPFATITLSVEEKSCTISSEDDYLPWDNPDNIISYETYLLMERGLFCYAIPTLFLVGVPTNLLNCVVFYRQGLRDRMNLCLFCLALVDMLFVALFFTMSSYCVVADYVDAEVAGWWKMMTRKYVTGLYRGFLFSSGCLTMIISVERCLCVFLPMKAVTLMKTRTMAALIAATILTLQSLCLLYPLKLEVVERRNARGTNKTAIFVIQLTQLYADNLALHILENVILMTVIPFFTFAVVVVATALTVIQLRRAIVWRSSASASTSASAAGITRKERGLVTMLVTVNCVFIITASPNIALGLTRSLVYDFWLTRRYANIFLAAHGWLLGLGVLNSSINFFVYVFRSSRFRQELRGLPLFGLCVARKKKTNASYLSASITNVMLTDTSARSAKKKTEGEKRHKEIEAVCRCS